MLEDSTVQLWHEKSVGICICYRPTFEASRIAQLMSDGNTQKPYAVYATTASGHAFHKAFCRMHILHIHGHLPLLNP